jgi:hypothetical protein
MATTTIKLNLITKQNLDQYREHKNESYDDVLKKLLYIIKKVKKEPELSKETILEIEKARKRIKSGHYYTEEEAKNRLGF